MKNTPTALIAATTLAVLAQQAQAQPQQSSASSIEPEGTITVPSFKLPPSVYVSGEARRAKPRGVAPQGAADRNSPAAIGAIRAGAARTMAAEMQQHVAAYPYTSRKTTIAGVPAIYYAPPTVPAPNRGKILFNIPGGGFTLGMADGTGLLESAPLASLAQVEVVSITYRQAPQFKHPAALEDIVAVYRELLKRYRPENIAVFGCSAGGVLTAQALARFHAEKLPMPRAAGIFCASADAKFGGDSSYWARPLIGLPYAGQESNLYFSDANRDDPTISPDRSPELLRRFPPTLIITSSRAFDLSGAVNTHRLLSKEGVDADLHVWDGFGHGFYFDLDLPEAREVFDVQARFFAKHLGLRIRR